MCEGRVIGGWSVLGVGPTVLEPIALYVARRAIRWLEGICGGGCGYGEVVTVHIYPLALPLGMSSSVLSVIGCVGAEMAVPHTHTRAICLHLTPLCPNGHSVLARWHARSGYMIPNFLILFFV